MWDGSPRCSLGKVAVFKTNGGPPIGTEEGMNFGFGVSGGGGGKIRGVEGEDPDFFEL